MKAAEEKLNAVHMIVDRGMSKSSVSQMTGIDKHLLNVYVSRYRDGGDEAVLRPRKYTEKEKLAIVKKSITGNVPVTSLSMSHGIPAITIRRWIRAYNEQGRDGLKDKGGDKAKNMRRSKYLKQLESDAELVVAIIDASINTLRSAANPFMRDVPKALSDKGLFDSPLFRYFLVELFRACRNKIKLSNSFTAWDTLDYSIVYTVACLHLPSQSLKGPSESDSIRYLQDALETDDCLMFMMAFIDSVPRFISSN